MKSDDDIAADYAARARELQKSAPDKAYLLYIEAWKLRKSYDIAANLASVEMTIGKSRDAAEHFMFALERLPRGPEFDEPRAQMNELILLRVRPRVGVAHIRVTRDDAKSAEGAKVFVDRNLVGEIDVNGALKQTLLSSDEVFLDSGSRTFSVTYQGCEPGVTTLPVEKGATSDVELLLPCRKRLSTPLLAAGLGIAAAGIGLGIGATVHSNTRSNDADALFTKLSDLAGSGACLLDQYQSDCEALQSAKTDTETFRQVAISGFVVGGASAVATAIYAIVVRSSSTPTAADKRAPLQASFSVGATGGGVLIGGRF